MHVSRLGKTIRIQPRTHRMKIIHRNFILFHNLYGGGIILQFVALKPSCLALWHFRYRRENQLCSRFLQTNHKLFKILAVILQRHRNLSTFLIALALLFGFRVPVT
jgi:hypothetical protein